MSIEQHHQQPDPPDPHRLREKGVTVATQHEAAAALGISRSFVRDLARRGYEKIRYIDVREPGRHPTRTRRYALEDIRAILPAYLAWRAKMREKALAREEKRMRKARIAKAARIAAMGRKAPKPTPKPSPKPKPAAPSRPLPPIVARGPEVFMMRRASR